MHPFPPYVTRVQVLERLSLIFPEGTPSRNYCVRELAASTVFTALYIGAVEGSGRYLGPVHVYRMTAEQAAKSNDADRENYAQGILRKHFQVSGIRWYADNTREPIRDETLRDGLVAIGAVLRREDLPTTSGNPRYALKSDFAALFDPAIEGQRLENAIAAFQAKHLSKSALARTSIMRSGAVATKTGILVTFANGETRKLAPGPSSIISKAVVEIFANRFLETPAVLWLSESGYLNLVAQPAAQTWAWWGRVIFYHCDVDALHASVIAAGYRADTAPRDAEWGERFFHLTDPDGHELSFAWPLRS